MNLIAAIQQLERRALKATKLAAAERARAQALRGKLQSIRRLAGILGASMGRTRITGVRKKRRLSPAGRARIIAAQKRRWAKARAARAA